MREVHPPPQDDAAQGVGTRQQRVLEIHGHGHHGHLVVLQVLHLVVRALREGVYVYLLVLGAGDEVALSGRRVAALQRQQRVRHPHALPHGEVGEHARRRAVGAVDNGRGGVRGVHQQARRLPVRGRHEGDARDAAAGELHLELELQGARVRGLQHVDAAALGAREQEEAGVVELQGADLCLHLELLQHHAVLHVHEAEHGVGVGRHEDLRVEGQEGRDGHRRGVREDLEHLGGIDAPEAH
mmetsp:Transcript_32967/g.97937  ORF Transcript_32967/g.97937 Transcript_32967/m.97937 type:complete len:241 (-) Transcript_32967:1090-1812(-)